MCTRVREALPSISEFRERRIVAGFGKQREASDLRRTAFPRHHPVPAPLGRSPESWLLRRKEGVRQTCKVLFLVAAAPIDVLC